MCPVDFSEFSRRALDHAVALARWYNSSITVLHVATPAPAPAVAPYVGPEALQPFALTDVDRERLRQELRIFVAAEGAPGVAIDTRVEEGIDVHEEILVQAQRLASDLIVLGTHGRSGFQRLFLGSVAEKVLRKAVCPVMTVPRAVPDAVPAGPGLFRRILCPVDFSKSSAAALDYALSIAQEADATLTVLHSVEVLPDMTEPPFVMGLNMPELMEASRERVRAMIPDTART
ncbi:MAG: universal stress protein, partial [Candidatus Rokuibacteriota bacterium]